MVFSCLHRPTCSVYHTKARGCHESAATDGRNKTVRRINRDDLLPRPLSTWNVSRPCTAALHMQISRRTRSIECISAQASHKRNPGAE